MRWKTSKSGNTQDRQSAKLAATLRPSLEALAFSVTRMVNVSDVEIRCQGKHPITGSTSVVRFNLLRTNQDFVRTFVNDFFYGNPRADVSDFLRRVKEKVQGAYVSELQIRGRDEEGDTIWAEFKFPSQSALEHIAEHGLFKLEDNSRSPVGLMVEQSS